MGEKAKKHDKQALKQSREAIAKKIYELSMQLVSQIDKEENPSIAIPVRGSRNVEFDKEAKKIVLGEKIAHRFLFNVGHARKFMQTMLVASYVKKDLLDQNLTATLRDLYYAKKRTITGSKEDTIDEQKESDLAIVDFEVALDTFREKLHLRAEPKGRIAGEMVVTDRVRDKVDTIDLGRMGSGGWAVPSIVEQIEFKDVGAEYVLVAEKNALFDRLNEDDYWKKNKCMIMTTAGQAARGARRFLQRLNEELKLPVYCLSVDAGEPVLLRGEDGLLRHKRIGEYVDRLAAVYGLVREGYYETTMAFDQAFQINQDFSSSPGSVTYAIRHPVSEDLLEVTAEGGSSCRVTKSHSLMVFDRASYSMKPKPTSELTTNDYLMSPSNLPNPQGLSELDWVEAIKQVKPDLLKSIEYTEKHIKWKLSKFSMKRKVKLDKEFCRLIGYYVSEGSISYDGVVLTFGSQEMHLAKDSAKCLKKALGLKKPIIYPDKNSKSIRVTFGGLLAVQLFAYVLGCGDRAVNKSAPDEIFNVPNAAKKAFLHGYFMGDGNAAIIAGQSARISATTISRKLAADLTVLLKQIGCVGTVKRFDAIGANSKEFYTVFVADVASLNKLKTLCLDLAQKTGIAQDFANHLQASRKRASKYLGIPKEIVAPLAEPIRRLGGRGIGRLLQSTPRHISRERLKNILSKIVLEATNSQKANIVFNALPAENGVTLNELAMKTRINKSTVNSCLRRLAREECATRISGSPYPKWSRGKNLFVGYDEINKITQLKKIVENNAILLPVKEIRPVGATNGFVYDLEVPPSHTFLCGVGNLCAHNTDADPYGWYIFSTMRYGSMALAHESDRLGCPNMKFLGMSISDIEHYDLRNVTIKAKDVDIKRAEEMKGYEWFKHKEWQNEINKFLDKKIKAEIQALSSKSLQYVSNVYLPEKIKSQDFLP